MKDFSDGLEKVLWFFYRVLFPAIPGVFFVLFVIFYAYIYFTGLNLNIDTIKNILVNVSNISATFILILSFIVASIFEGIGYIIVFKLMKIASIANKIYDDDKNLKIMAERLSKDTDNIVNLSPNGKLYNGSLSLNLAIVLGNSNYPFFNNYFWFLISREYILINIVVCLISIVFFFCPLTLCKLNKEIFDNINFFFMQIVQIVLIILLIYTSKKVIIDFFEKDSNLKISIYYGIILSFISILGMVGILFFDNNSVRNWGILILCNALLFTITPLCIARVIREFLHIEYLIAATYIHSKYKDIITTK